MTQEVQERQDSKPVYGSSGRKIIYDENGKPCRTCNTLLDFQMATHGTKVNIPTPKPSLAIPNDSPKEASKSADSPYPYQKEYPPDVTKLGNHSWTLLHTIAAAYPEKPSIEQQNEMKTFLNIFAKIYPCWYCGKDFQSFIKKNEPKVMTQDDFGKWLCNAHNSVNIKLGKPKFKCELWKKRWKDGWDE
ncbi:flavin-linked sulfhydryl oxidase ASCRUDRAFT_77710 [Ascoidea rubescens DSM 1968]|uniref:Sulfhydryl oxidase n=1 Tax=Ascoidea rubescens DSM 1968 TaxID=1344418 RepID=A0A1D2VB84_9ASCO|nr:hypothetical protein ASCRUDRAFT_77710 [Ascoidea rubescens DSM 1968]ODV58707.1 hypothetical protein ASCRUDRAFT_77710 [Ascoidea rubescens DSM 1968]